MQRGRAGSEDVGGGDGGAGQQPGRGVGQGPGSGQLEEQVKRDQERRRGEQVGEGPPHKPSSRTLPRERGAWPWPQAEERCLSRGVEDMALTHRRGCSLGGCCKVNSLVWAGGFEMTPRGYGDPGQRHPTRLPGGPPALAPWHPKGLANASP